MDSPHELNTVFHSWEEYEQATPSLLWATHNQKEWEMSSLVAVDQSLPSIATAKIKKKICI